MAERLMKETKEHVRVTLIRMGSRRWKMTLAETHVQIRCKGLIVGADLLAAHCAWNTDGCMCRERL